MIGARWFVSGKGVMDRRFSRAPLPMSGDRCALVAVRQRETSVYDRPASVFRDEGGPTMALSRAAERATIKRYRHIKEYMFVNRCWRRRLERAVGPGHGSRRVFGSPDHAHGRDVRSFRRAGTCDQSGWQGPAVAGDGSDMA